jgi:hypothetical protein
MYAVACFLGLRQESIKNKNIINKPSLLLSMVTLSMALKHYKRKEVQEEIVYNAKNREIAVRYGDHFGKRPDILSYPYDILELARQGATSIHASEELWKNPSSLSPGMRRKDLDALRQGWDLLLDIDCHILEYSKIASDLIVKALKYYNINSISVKFSGNKGFHIGVPFEAFPKKVGNKEVRLLFPEAPKAIASYIRDMIKEKLAEDIMKLEKNDFNSIVEKTGKKAKEITEYKQTKAGKVAVLNVEPFLNIDTLLISSRHLFRMPYSFHEKSGLVSVPINPDKIMEFDKSHADYKELVVEKRHRFLDKENVRAGEAKNLLIQALDFGVKIKRKEVKERKEFEIPTIALPERYFPPCIKKISQGLEDGRKRSVFILINFLSSVGWSHDEIKKMLYEWNKKNKEPLKEVYILGQLKHHKQQKKKILPPNCDNPVYYKDIRVCLPDNLCKNMKNPVNYALRKTRFLRKEKEKT